MTNDYTYLERGDTHREFPYSERRPAHHLAKVQMYAASDPDQLVNLAGTGLPAEAALRGTLARHNSRTNLDAAEWRCEVPSPSLCSPLLPLATPVPAALVSPPVPALATPAPAAAAAAASWCRQS